MFVGTHERQLDDKGRLALPPSFRAEMQGSCYIALGEDRCLTIFAPADFEQLAEEMLEQVKRGEISRSRLRAVSSSAALVSVDKQGRITIDERLRAYAQLEPSSRIIVSGRFDCAEIWSEAVYSSVTAAGEGELANLSGLVGVGGGE